MTAAAAPAHRVRRRPGALPSNPIAASTQPRFHAATAALRDTIAAGWRPPRRRWSSILTVQVASGLTGGFTQAENAPRGLDVRQVLDKWFGSEAPTDEIAGHVQQAQQHVRQDPYQGWDANEDSQPVRWLEQLHPRRAPTKNPKSENWLQTDAAAALRFARWQHQRQRPSPCVLAIRRGASVASP